MSDRPLRILHCPANVAGNPYGIALAERELGLESHTLTFEQGPFLYPVDEVLFEPGDGMVEREVKRWKLLSRALRDFDVIHFNMGRSIFPMRYSLFGPARQHYPGLKQRLADAYISAIQLRDLPILKRAGKGIFVTYQGNDARQGDYCRAHFTYSTAHEDFETYTPEGDEEKRRAIRAFGGYADRIYSLNPDLMHVLPPQTQFQPYASVDPLEWPLTPAHNEVPLVLHAPSRRGMKGSAFILEAVERLKAEGVPFEFMLVENMPHAEARQLYARADLLIDQLLAGWYGALAVELMAMGKPVVCYIRQEDLGFLPAGMREDMPLISAEPPTIYEVLKALLSKPREELTALGQRSRRYVERWHDPRRIAADLKGEYEQVMAARSPEGP